MFKSSLQWLLYSVAVFMLSVTLNASAAESVTLKMTARVVAAHNITLSSQLDAPVLKVAREGSRLQKGDVVALLDTEQLSFELKQSEALLRYYAKEIDISNKKVKRLSVLREKNSASQEAFETAQLQLWAAERNYQFNQQKADSVKDLIGKATITAPFDLVVTKRISQSHEYVSKGTAMVAVSSISQLQIIGTVANPLVARIAMGAQVSARFGGEQVDTSVSQLYPLTGQQNTPYEFRAELSANWPIGTSLTVNLNNQKD